MGVRRHLPGMHTSPSNTHRQASSSSSSSGLLKGVEQHSKDRQPSSWSPKIQNPYTVAANARHIQPQATEVTPLQQVMTIHDHGADLPNRRRGTPLAKKLPPWWTTRPRLLNETKGETALPLSPHPLDWGGQSRAVPFWSQVRLGEAPRDLLGWMGALFRALAKAPHPISSGAYTHTHTNRSHFSA